MSVDVTSLIDKTLLANFSVEEHDKIVNRKIIKGDPICEKVELTKESNTYTLPEQISINSGDFFYIEYDCCDAETGEVIAKSCYHNIAKCVSTDHSIYFLSTVSSNCLKITQTAIIDTWVADNRKSIVSIYKVTFEDSFNSGEIAIEGVGSIKSGFFSHAEGSVAIARGQSSHAEGSSTFSSGDFSHAEGRASQVAGTCGHVEGYGGSAPGNYTHVEGYSNRASAECSHAEGSTNNVISTRSHAEGAYNYVNGYGGHAEGYYNTVGLQYGHVEGLKSVAGSLGICNHAEGQGVAASGTDSSHMGSHAEGSYGQFLKGTLTGEANAKTFTTSVQIDKDWLYCVLSIDNTQKTIVSAIITEIGDLTVTVDRALSTTAYTDQAFTVYNHCAHGFAAHVEGYSNRVRGDGSHGEGAGNLLIGDYAHIGGNDNVSKSTSAFTYGYGNLNYGTRSAILGSYNFTAGTASIALGDGIASMGHASIAEGEGGSNIYGSNILLVTFDSASYDETTGLTTVTLKDYILCTYSDPISHYDTTTLDTISLYINGTRQEGICTVLAGSSSGTNASNRFTIEGDLVDALNSATTVAIRQKIVGGAFGQASHAEGYATRAIGNHSHTEGEGTRTLYPNQHASGTYNLNKEENIFEIGNGTSDTVRSNCLELTKDGNLKVSGTITDGNGNVIGGIKVTSTISGSTVAFTSDSITDDSFIDGPYIKNSWSPIDSVSYNASNHTVTYTLGDSNSSGKEAAIFIK